MTTRVQIKCIAKQSLFAGRPTWLRWAALCYSHKMLNVFILIVSTLSTFTVLEVAARIYGSHAVFAWRDYRGQTLNLYKMRLPIQFDSSLGWIPKIGFSTTDNKWGTQVTIVDHGIRPNGNREDEIFDKTPLLAVGDSFTFGDEVSDSETWPAILERLLNKKVINAGVFAYGIDQTFIRLTMLLNIYAPDTIIFSFIPTDIGHFCILYCYWCQQALL